jgi:hypothetical protein
VRDEGEGFCAKMPEEFPPKTEIDKDPICESSSPLQPIVIEEELEDHYDIEEFPMSESDLGIDNEDDTYYVGNGVYIVYFPGGYWKVKKNTSGDIIDYSKFITDPLIEAKYNV